MDKVRKSRGTKTRSRDGGIHAASADADAEASPPADMSLFPIVGVGASAGGLDAFTELLQHVQPNSGMAFVLVQHLDPTHESYLSEVLARSAKLPVAEIRDGMRVERDHVYVMPPNAELGLLQRTFVLLPRPAKRGAHLPIDFFFQALAADLGNQAIGVVLSGTGSDGAEGLRAIKAEEGVAFAQEPSSAQHRGMPEAAIETGIVDFVLPIPALAEELVRLGRHPFLGARKSEPPATESNDRDLAKAVMLLRSAVGVDFSEYKGASIRRRIARRMAVHRSPNMEDYLRILHEDRKEPQALFDDILIHVTSFFRDPDAFEALKRTVFPPLLAQKKAGDTIRVWSAGCSTGEEAYSLVIALREYLIESKADDVRVQLFGSDISELAIAKARSGVYRAGIERDVSPQRLAMFFSRLDGKGYRINKDVREQCAFVKHDLASDPPFSKIDLVSCRNLLIYFGSDLQKRALATFHFALGRPGFLLLGNAENVADSSHLFSLVDKQHRLFARSATKSTMRLIAGQKPRGAEVVRLGAAPGARAATSPDFLRRAASLLLDRYVPPGVIINDRLEILHFLGRTAPYLETPAGPPQHDLLRMAHKGLTTELQIAISQARRENSTVRRTARFDHDGASRQCELVVTPIVSSPSSGEQVLAVLFEEPKPLAPPTDASSSAGTADADGTMRERRIAQLEAELEANREHLRAIIGEQQVTNEELFSSNEELMSTNEELQSLNEEVETAKEELQSTNEELSTLNEELSTRNSELNSLNSDLINILGSVEVPIVIVDQARLIRRFTPKARTILNLLPSDIGRPIDDIKPTLAIDRLDEKIAEVIESIRIHEEEVRAKDGRWYRLQIRPYKTVDKRIDGAVMSIIDIDVLKRAVSAAEWARDYANATVEAVRTPLVVLDAQATILSSNEAFRAVYGAPPIDGSLYAVGQGALDIPELREAFGRFVNLNHRFEPLLVERELPEMGSRSLCLTASAVLLPNDQRLNLLAVEDISERRRQDEDRVRLLADTEAAKATAEHANRTKDKFLAIVSHELRTPLSSLLLQTQLLRRGELDSARLARACDVIERATKAQAQLVDDLLDISRIVTGKLAMEQRSVNVSSIVQIAVDIMTPIAAKKQVTLLLKHEDASSVVSGDPARLQQVVLNLLTNAVKFTPSGGRVEVVVDVAEDRVRVRVMDTGIGIDADFLPHLFSRFSQESRGENRTHGGLGLGLAIVHHMIQAHGGTVVATSEGRSKGSQFTVLLPLLKARMASVPPPRDSRSPSEPAAANIQDVRVLVVDDDPDTRGALSEMLELCGADVRAADSAAQAMVLFEPFQPELLVTDISMPEEDGYQLLARIRALGQARGGDVPALALTALAGDEDRKRALAAGFQAYLAKPVDLDRLVAELARLHTRGTLR